MREYKPPRTPHPPYGKSLWIPIRCVECGKGKHDAEGRTLYADLLAGPAWREGRDGRREPYRPALWRCPDCQQAWEALRALDGRDAPVDDTF